MWIASMTRGLAVLLAMAFPARADPVADFYRGKTVRVLVGVGAGGDYDVHARLLARHLGKHIPGNPAVICSGSSSGPMVTASICCWGPTTCSSAERNSTASRPWVTSTKPIIDLPAGAVRRTKGPPSSRSEVGAQGVFLLFLRPCCIAVSGALTAARQGPQEA